MNGCCKQLKSNFKTKLTLKTPFQPLKRAIFSALLNVFLVFGFLSPAPDLPTWRIGPHSAIHVYINKFTLLPRRGEILYLGVGAEGELGLKN